MKAVVNEVKVLVSDENHGEKKKSKILPRIKQNKKSHKTGRVL